MPLRSGLGTNRRELLARRLAEVAVFGDRHWLSLGPAAFEGDGVRSGTTIEQGAPWPLTSGGVRMSWSVAVPEAWSDLPVVLRIKPGGEALLRVDGHPVGGLNPHHCEYSVPPHSSGRRLEIEVEAVPRGMFGIPKEAPTLERAELVVPDQGVRDFLRDVRLVLETANYLDHSGRSEPAELLTDAAERSLRGLPIPRHPSDRYLARHLAHRTTPGIIDAFWDAETEGDLLATLWEPWKFGEVTDNDDAALLFAALPERRTALQKDLAEVRRRYPHEGQLLVTGHSHIDLAWLWPFDETRRKIHRTWSTVLGVLDAHDDFHFVQGSAQAYAWFAEDDPEQFARLQRHVKEGRWEVVGGLWVEPDGNLLSGESWARQVLYGQRWFQEHLGTRARVCWLPDTFGYAGNLPQILRGGGLDYFFTTKLSWGEHNQPPLDLYQWEGIDGTRILSHTFDNPNDGYNGHMEPLDLGETWRNFRGKRLHDESLFCFGPGDGGGGPSSAMIEDYERMREMPALPSLEMGRVEEFYDRASSTADKAPVWVGEKYLELHRGTYTTQAQTKWLNRRLEHTLVEAETAATLQWLSVPEATTPDPSKTGDLWRKLLLYQFHDVLPGTSIRTVFDRGHEELGGVLRQAEDARDAALGKLSSRVAGEKPRLVLWNLQLGDRPLHARVTPPSNARPFHFRAPDGQVVHQEQEGDTLLLSSPTHTVPGMGYLALDVVDGAPPPTQSTLQASNEHLENEHLSVGIGADGTITSLVDKATGREALADRGNQIWVYPDMARKHFWDAWDVDEGNLADGREVIASEPPQVVSDGPASVAVEVIREVEGGRIRQVYRLASGARRLDIETRIEWRARRTMLRARFPLAVRCHEAWFETAFGAVPRPTHRNTSWDLTRFEVPALRWADMSEAGFGVSLLNNGKYGHSALGSMLELNLLRSPIYPDPYADEGEHGFTYALYPHQGDWRTGTVDAAADLDAPLTAVSLQPGSGDWPATQRLLSVEGEGLQLSCLKPREDGEGGAVLRLYEARGGRTSGRVTLPMRFSTAAVSDLLEQETDFIARDAESFGFEMTPFQVVTFVVTPTPVARELSD